MKKTKAQLEQELATAKQEAAMWKEAHAVALKAWGESLKQPIWIGGYQWPYFYGYNQTDGPTIQAAPAVTFTILGTNDIKMPQ